jgi:hypothetical protein
MTDRRPDPSDHNPLAQELTAQIQVGLFGTVGRLAKQLRVVDRVAPALREAGLVRPLTIDRTHRRRAVGFSAAHRSISAFGGLLYAVGVLRHELTAEGSAIMNSGQDSRVEVGDLTHFESDRRLKWKTYTLMYDLLQEVFDATAPPPELLILDVPLLIGRQDQAVKFDDPELAGEISRLRERAEAFWSAYRGRCYPFAEDGPKVVTLRPGVPGELLYHLHDPKQGRACSPDPIGAEAETLVRQRWTEILSANLGRVMQGLLTPESRTAGYASAATVDPRELFPRSLVSEGMTAFHYQAGLRGRPVFAETLGGRDRWMPSALDDLAASLIALTYFDHRSAMPLPLWYAREAVAVIRRTERGKGWLDAYKSMVRQSLREEHVDQTWLAGWEEE